MAIVLLCMLCVRVCVSVCAIETISRANSAVIMLSLWLVQLENALPHLYHAFFCFLASSPSFVLFHLSYLATLPPHTIAILPTMHGKHTQIPNFRYIHVELTLPPSPTLELRSQRGPKQFSAAFFNSKECFQHHFAQLFLYCEYRKSPGESSASMRQFVERGTKSGICDVLSWLRDLIAAARTKKERMKNGIPNKLILHSVICSRCSLRERERALKIVFRIVHGCSHCSSQCRVACVFLLLKRSKLRPFAQKCKRIIKLIWNPLR